MVVRRGRIARGSLGALTSIVALRAMLMARALIVSPYAK
jgi:hypothetical protein